MSTEEEWCDYGDLPKIMCEHCQTGQKNAGTNVGGLGTSGRPVATELLLAEGDPIIARFAGACAARGDCERQGVIAPDDWIVRSRTGGWLHEECAQG